MTLDDRRSSKIDCGSFSAEVKGNGLEIEELDERGGKQVLAGVLLHVVDAARPIDLPVHGTKG